MAAPLKHKTVSAMITESLREAILSGARPAGSMLRQDSLGDAYGVSRIPVREALFQLEAQGLVRIVPHKGAVVAEFSLDEINDVFDLRGLLEPRLLAASAPHFTKADLLALEVIQARFEAAIAARDISAWGHLNAEFHGALYLHANLPRTRSIMTSLLQTSDRYTRLQLSTPAAMQVARDEHAELIRLCRGGGIPEACRFLATHLEKVRSDLLRTLR